MELPIKEAVFDKLDPEMGLKMVSLVSDPAIQIGWIKFDEQTPIKLAIQNEEKRIIFTPVLIPDQKIYRNIGGEEFNLRFSAQTIEEVAMDWQQKNLSSSVDINHNQQLIEGVTFFETFLKSSDRNPTQKGFEKLPEGTWFLTGKVNSDEVWVKIQSGEITGVSIDGLFKTAKVQAACHLTNEQLEQIIYNL